MLSCSTLLHNIRDGILDMCQQIEFEREFNELFDHNLDNLLPTMKEKITDEVFKKELLENIKQNLINSIVNPAWETDTEWNKDTSAECPVPSIIDSETRKGIG